MNLTPTGMPMPIKRTAGGSIACLSPPPTQPAEIGRALIGLEPIDRRPK